MSELVEKFSGIMAKANDATRAITDGIEALRRDIIDLRQERDDLADVPVDVNIACARVDRWAAQMITYAQTAAPSPSSFISGHPDWRPYQTEPTVGLMAYLGDELAEAAKARVREVYEDIEGISDEERAKRLAAIEAKILAAELSEEAIIRASERAGLNVMRRPDANPRAVFAHESAFQ